MPLLPVPRPEGHRSFTWLGVAAIGGALLGLALIPTTGGVRAGGAMTLHLFGQSLPAGPDAIEVAHARVNHKFEGWFNLELPDGEQRRVNYSSLGVELDRLRLGQLIRAAREGVFPVVSRGALAVSPDRPGRDALELIIPLRLDRERLLGTLLALKDELDRAAVDARLDLDRKAVVAERAGRLLDVDRSALAIERALEAGADGAQLWFETRAPRRVTTELASVRYDTRLGFFETRYDPKAGAKDRTFNLQRVASKLDGYVLPPGGELDFNAVVGPRDEANGYRVAEVMAQGELVDGVGGGTSQLSSTLHAAALFAGLDVIERHAHTRATPSVELGLDAAVAYPAINLRLANPYDFPVVLRQIVADGRVRAEIRGARRPHTITLIRKIDGATPFEEIERSDITIARGVRVLAQRAVPGIDLHRYRIRRDGSHAVREVSFDRYPPTPQLVLVGAGAPALAGAPNMSEPATTGRPPYEPAPEYLVDELLVMTQSPELDGPLVEQRVVGRSGVPGWAKNIGAPAWLSSR
jgi:vancomycin resistance protein YoaR